MRYHGRVILLLFAPVLLLGRLIQVGADHEFQDLATAIARSQPHDTITVNSGYYPEYDLIIDHPLILLAIGEVQIDGQGKGEILRVNADSTHIRGFTFLRSGLSYIDDNAAIKLNDSRGSSILGNIFEDNFFAIYLARSVDCVIKGNWIQGQAKTESKSGNGIHLWYCKNILITDNGISGHRDGIYLEFVEDCRISDNHSYENIRYGLHFMFSDNNSYSENVFVRNGAGVAVMYSRNVDMVSNQFLENWGGASYGLLLKDIYDSRIEANTFTTNTIGIYAEASSRVEVLANTFQHNGWAMKIMANSMENSISGNNFIDNSFDVATNSVQNFNTYSGNFWSRYTGYDLDHDGRGDVPHRPVSMFSVLTQNNDPALVLLRSLFIGMLDAAERYLPIFTPESLLDPEPSMDRIP